MWSLDLLTGERQARSDCQLWQAVITRTEKKTVGLCDKERTVTINFGSGRKLKGQDLRKKGSKGRGRIGGDGHTVEPYVRHNTDKNPYLLSHGDWQFLAFPQALWKGNTFITTCDVDKHLLAVELSLLLLAWDSLHGLSLNLKVWICEGGRQTCEGVFPTIQI